MMKIGSNAAQVAAYAVKRTYETALNVVFTTACTW